VFSSPFTREVTATFTTAGVTREATASIALSSATRGATLWLSSGGAAATAAAWAALCPEKRAKVRISTAAAARGATNGFDFATKELVEVDILLSPLALNLMVEVVKKVDG
jgi:hypothetical protein